jgi:hypothetical protein
MSFRTQITPLRRADIPELSKFLISGMGFPETVSFYASEVLSWKYFDGPSASSGDSVRSLVARSEGRIVGHVGMRPGQFIIFRDGATLVSTMRATDWLSAAAHPGLGAFLMREVFATSKTQYAFGGTVAAEALFPLLGFEKKPKVAQFRKVLAPFHRIHTSGFRKWARPVKDLWSVLRSRTLPVTQTVELLSTPAFTEEIDGLQQQSSLRIVTCQRNHLLLNYLLRCPLSDFSGWTIHTSQRLIGFAVLKIEPRGRIRFGTIADCWLDTEDPTFWQAAVAALVDRLRAQSVDDVKCYATTPSLHTALLWNGFTKCGEKDVYIRDPQQLLPRDIGFGLSRFELDG